MLKGPHENPSLKLRDGSADRRHARTFQWLSAYFVDCTTGKNSSASNVGRFAIPPHIAVSDFVRRVKGRSSHRVQMEFPDLRKRYWGRHFWARGYAAIVDAVRGLRQG